MSWVLAKRIRELAASLGSTMARPIRGHIPLTAATVQNVSYSAPNDLVLLVTSLRLQDVANQESYSVKLISGTDGDVTDGPVPLMFITEQDAVDFGAPVSGSPLTSPIRVGKGQRLRFQFTKPAEVNNLFLSGIALEANIAQRIIKTLGRLHIWYSTVEPNVPFPIFFDRAARVDSLFGWADAGDDVGKIKVLINHERGPPYELHPFGVDSPEAFPRSPNSTESYLGEHFVAGNSMQITTTGPDSWPATLIGALHG